jgi:hypothetical protein
VYGRHQREQLCETWRFLFLGLAFSRYEPYVTHEYDFVTVPG